MDPHILNTLKNIALVVSGIMLIAWGLTGCATSIKIEPAGAAAADSRVVCAVDAINEALEDHLTQYTHAQILEIHGEDDGTVVPSEPLIRAVFEHAFGDIADRFDRGLTDTEVIAWGFVAEKCLGQPPVVGSDP